MNSEQEAQIVLKLLLLGDSSVGKTSILLNILAINLMKVLYQRWELIIWIK